MKPVDMQFFGTPEGDCLMACAASILECQLEELPAITKLNEAQWFQVFGDAMNARGFHIVELANEPAIAPPGYAIAIGPSPRVDEPWLEPGQSETHACVARDGAIVHDPHPTRSGVSAVIFWMMLVPLARSPLALMPHCEASAGAGGEAAQGEL